MSDATKDRDTAQGGFSSRWMLDRNGSRPARVGGNANTSANAIDTNGDGVADTLALRVDAHRPSAISRFGRWASRSFVTILVVAALVAAAAAATNLVQTRTELDGATAERDALRAEVAAVRADLDTARAEVAEFERDAAGATDESAKVVAERDELELEVRVLRRMLLDAERRAAAEA